MSETIELDGLDDLLKTLRARGYTLVGPTLRDRAIVYEEIAGADDLPAGWTEHQDGGTYRVERREDEALLRLRGRAALVEALPASAGPDASGRRAARRTGPSR